MSNVPKTHGRGIAPSAFIVSLRQVASWDLKHLEEPCEIQVGVPALQRGLVWDAARVELLWDSIFRGFPIGSLVVTSMIESQRRDGQSDITHHLLDGQQRCNAIAVGFHDPFNDSDGEVRGNVGDAILWLDLTPGGGVENLPPRIPGNSTREFLFRVTNRAHPWGFSADDDAKRISFGQMQSAIESSRRPDRPEPRDLFPVISNAPIPLSWLLLALRKPGDATNMSDETTFWAAVESRLISTSNLGWPTKTLDILRATRATSPASLGKIYQGVCRASQSLLVVLETPADLTVPSSREANSTDDLNEGISNVEHLFARLNQQGVRLDGEELAYSLIKAYCPEVVPSIESVSHRRIPASKLAALAIRAALTRRDDEKLAVNMGISQIRAMASRQGSDPRHQSRRAMVLEYLMPCDGAQGALASACATVDRWLVFDPETNAEGLPPVLVSSIARTSTDIYLLLLLLASDPVLVARSKDPEWRKAVIGLVTVAHWFGDDKGKIANAVWSASRVEANATTIRQGLQQSVENWWLVPPLSPDKLEGYLALPSDEEALKGWKWWNSLVGEKPEAVREEWGRYLWSTVGKTIWNRELLLYAQRNFLFRRFPDYDPSRKDLWENHNRPWDFDHIHAHAYFYNKKDSSLFREVCGEFGYTIGNLRAWPMEENRSDQKTTACEKMDYQQQILSFVLPTEVTAFSHGDGSRRHMDKAKEFCVASRDRYLRIYKNWYDAAGIAGLVSDALEPSAITGPIDLN